MPLTDRLRVSRLVLNIGAKVLLLDGHFRLRAMRQLRVEGDVARIQQQIPVWLIAREQKVAISKSGGVMLSELARKVALIVRRESTLMYLLKTIQNCAIVFEKHYNEKIVATTF